MTSKKLILYIGGFELPDKNAAAHRVLANAKALYMLGYSVVFLGITHDNHSSRRFVDRSKKIDNFEYYEVAYPKSILEWIAYSTKINFIKILVDRTMPMNNRKILELFLCLPREERITDSIHKAVMDEMNPKVLRAGVEIPNLYFHSYRIWLEKIYFLYRTVFYKKA